jgi:alkylation response protein AidB-like acyl-CoA dehydrogenase
VYSRTCRTGQAQASERRSLTSRSARDACNEPDGALFEERRNAIVRKAMPAKEEGADTPFGAFFRRESAAILDTWHTLGMRGTGSADYTVTNLYVPEHLTVPVAPLRNPPPGFEGPLFRMWPWTAIIGEATVSVGVAAAAVDAAVHLCMTKTPAYQGTSLRDQQLAS